MRSPDSKHTKPLSKSHHFRQQRQRKEDKERIFQEEDAIVAFQITCVAEQCLYFLTFQPQQEDFLEFNVDIYHFKALEIQP